MNHWIIEALLDLTEDMITIDARTLNETQLVVVLKAFLTLLGYNVESENNLSHLVFLALRDNLKNMKAVDGLLQEIRNK